MAKRRNNGIFKQTQILTQFSIDIRQAQNKNWLTVSEQAQLSGEQYKKREEERLAQAPQPRISMYNPNNPLNGSSHWTKEQHQAYKKANAKH
jgi:hypothetical protein